MHPALARGRVAVITGAASGIGLAAARACAQLGMKLVLADIDAAALAEAAANLAGAELIACRTDVSHRQDIVALEATARATFGEVALLMNNAGREGGGQLLGDPARWQAILDTNLWGTIHGIQAFAPGMMAQGTPCAIVNTGSKQGITTPPGDTAYNVSKAGIKVVTEALAHDLRSVPGCAVTAHLLIPGFTFTGLTRVHTPEKSDAAWLPEQVIDFLFDAMARGDFYVLCPDNAVPRATDEKRIRWAADDIVRNRPALSRWHPDFAAEFAAFMAQK
jgi:NAD(P)-dependent dehydrogenase (short-subunit alcohol dehydrogenase family)